MKLYVGCTNEYMQHTIILLKSENISINYRHLLPDLEPGLNLIGWNYPSLKQISLVPKMFKPLKFDCNYFALCTLYFSNIYQVIGIGAGQQSRIHCTRLAGDKANNW